MVNVEFFQRSAPPNQNSDSASAQPFSFPSEPPDIRNWFSSYKYDSEESEIFHDPEGAEGKGKVHFVEDLTKEDSIPSQIDAFSLEMDSLPPEGKELQLKVRFTSKRNSNWNRPLNASSQKGKSTSTIGTCSCVSFPSVENEYKLITKKESHDVVNIIIDQNQCLRGQVMALPDNCELKSKKDRQHDESNGSNTYPEHGKLILEDKQSLERCIDEDKREKNVALLENEFVSTRNRMSSIRTVVMQGAQNLNGNVERGISLKRKEVTFISGEKQPPIASTALAEKTNVCSAEETIAVDVPGKWKCPRKSKPYIGPPLKQLRLERWVRRVL